MNVLVSTEARFDRTPDGACWTIGSAGFNFWKRYLDEFDEVRIVARMRDAATPPEGGVRADGPNVTLAGLPYYIGPWQYAQQRSNIRRAIRELLISDDAVIARAPGPIGAMLVAGIQESDPSRPFGVEVVGDPYDALAPRSIRTILRPFLRWSMPRTLRMQCARACAVAYVTANSLQRRYPAREDAFVTSYSSIDLPDEAFAPVPRSVPSQRPSNGAKRVIFVGTLEQLYKAPDVLIDALAIARQSGADLRLAIIGDGKHRPELEARAEQLGLVDRIRFLGALPSGGAIRAELDQSDLFVLPSHQEGLPRAMIEAMARGVPSVGTSVGGIPELLAPSEMVPAADAAALASKMLEILRDPDRLAKLSAEHLQKARQYHSRLLRPRHQALYRTVRDATARWLEVSKP